VEYRKRAIMSKKDLLRVNDDILEQVERWHALLSFYPDSIRPISQFSVPADLPRNIGSLEQIDELVDSLRAAWGFGTGIIPDLTDALEKKGIMVISTNADKKSLFDGLQCSVGDFSVIAINAHFPGDRQRLTIAHELGHLVLEGRVVGDLALDKKGLEKACTYFAGAFLLPKNEIISHLGSTRSGIEGRELYLLKHEFGISMAAVLYRAKQAGIISEHYLKTGMIEFAKKGWKKLEPGDSYKAEKTYLFDHLLYRALGQDLISEAKAAELAKKSVSDFHMERMLWITDAKVINK
jgi:Zn-dependent peptidase ImmA (M78 family)